MDYINKSPTQSAFLSHSRNSKLLTPFALQSSVYSLTFIIWLSLESYNNSQINYPLHIHKNVSVCTELSTKSVEIAAMSFSTSDINPKAQLHGDLE